MDDHSPIFNSRITKVYLEYVRERYPQLREDELLKHAGMNRYAVEDPAHWFSQRQVERFHDILVQRTANPHISRDVGRYAASAQALGTVRQYALGFLTPGSAYKVAENFTARLTRGHRFKTRRLSENRMEVTVSLEPGVFEKPFQCENRLGMLESLAKIFTNKHAEIHHPDCIHEGRDVCRYEVSWEKTPALTWKRIRSHVLLGSILAGLLSLFLLAPLNWLKLTVILALVNTSLSSYAHYVEKKDLTRSIERQGDVAKDLLDEMTIRYNNAMLIQEIGQAISAIRDVGKLTEAVVKTMEKRLDFDRGMIMLPSADHRLVHSAGYGYRPEQEALLKETEFRLDKSDSKGVFVLSFKRKMPFLISDIAENYDQLSERSLAFARKMKAKSLICVPIMYENESLGIVVVDNIKSKRILTQSDMSLLMGVASQSAVSIINARSFEKLRESEERFKALSRVTLEGIAFHDRGILVDVNASCLDMFGYEYHELIGKDVIEMLIAPAYRNLVRRHVAAGYDRTYEVLGKRKEGFTFPLEVEARQAPYMGKNLSVASFRDLTERKAAEKEKEKLEHQLQQAQKMEAIGMLAGGVAHDLNNILAGIVSYPELLLMDVAEDSPLRQPMLTIKASGEKAATIVQDLLTLARRGVSTRQVINLNDVIKDFFSSPEYEKIQLYSPDVNVMFDLEADLFNMVGSPVHLSKTLMNLVSNAAEATPQGGKITVSTRNLYLDKTSRAYEPIKEGDYVTVAVADDGIGISPEDLQHIFEPFYTKKAMGRSGTGLGMAVVWGTVKDHKGYIDVRSTKGRGTTFTLYFPVTRKAPASRAVPFSIREYMGNNESIVVVDDVETQRQVASGMLEKLGYTVNVLSSGEAAVAYMKDHHADLLVLDMIMEPGLDGLDTYREIIKIHPGQKAIITSGFSETARVKEAQKLGAGIYVRKPYSLEKIGRAVKNALKIQKAEVGGV